MAPLSELETKSRSRDTKDHVVEDRISDLGYHLVGARLRIDANDRSVTEAGIQTSPRVELDGRGSDEPLRHHRHRPGLRIDLDDFAQEGLGRIEHAVGAEIEAIQLGDELRSSRIAYYDSRGVLQVGIEFIEAVAHERLTYEQTAAQEGDRVHPRGDELLGDRAVGCPSTDFSEQDIGPVDGTVGADSYIVGAIYPDVVPELLQDLPGLRVERDQFAAEHTGDEEAAVLVDRESVRSVDGCSADEDLRLIRDIGTRGAGSRRCRTCRRGVRHDHEGAEKQYQRNLLSFHQTHLLLGQDRCPHGTMRGCELVRGPVFTASPSYKWGELLTPRMTPI